MTMAHDLKLRVVAPMGDHCGEGLVWSAADNALYWTDVCRFLVHRLSLDSGAVKSWTFDEPCVALSVTDCAGTLLLGIGSRLILWQPATDTRTDHGFKLQGWPTLRLNEGRAGPGGEFWVGSMANNVGPDGEVGAVDGLQGVLYRIKPGTAPWVAKTGIGISNTMCFSPDQRFLYFGDTVQNMIWRFNYDRETQSISGEVPFFAGFARGKPDGSAIDAEGFLWNCRFGGGCVVRIAPDGQIDRVIDMPVSNITTCEFGGPGLRTLYITTSTILLNRHERLAGSLFALDAPVAGAPPHTFALSS
jgi:sugar lactone lactonase YvrE